MEYLIAADVIVQAERKRLDLDAWLRAHPDDDIKLAAITVAELWRSVERASGEHRAKREEFLLTALKVFDVAPYSERAAAQHARLWAIQETTGQRINLLDLILAATALERGASIVTYNTRRFAAIPELTVIAP